MENVCENEIFNKTSCIQAPKQGNNKKARKDFVRFDTKEIHYTDNDEVHTKITEEIKR